MRGHLLAVGATPLALADSIFTVGLVLFLAGSAFGLGAQLLAAAGGPNLRSRLTTATTRELGRGFVFLTFPLLFVGPTAAQAADRGALTLDLLLTLLFALPLVLGGLLSIALALGVVERGERSVLADVMAGTVLTLFLVGWCVLGWTFVAALVGPLVPVSTVALAALWATPWVVLLLVVLALIATKGSRVPERARGARLRGFWDE